MYFIQFLYRTRTHHCDLINIQWYKHVWSWWITSGLSSLVHARRHPTATNIVNGLGMSSLPHISWAKIVGKYSLFHEIFGKFAFDRDSSEQVKNKKIQRLLAIVVIFNQQTRWSPELLNICAKLLSLISQKWWFLTHKKTVISQIRARNTLTRAIT